METAPSGKPVISTTLKAEEYLHGRNFKALIEWITAESILYQPEDPISFIRDMLEDQMSSRGFDKHYKPEDNSEYVKAIYKTASDCTDAEGTINIPPERIKVRSGKAFVKKEAENKLVSFEEHAYVQEKLKMTTDLVYACKSIALHLQPKDAANSIIKEVERLLDCDRASIYRVDRVTDEIELMVAEGDIHIRVPIGVGIAGTCASNGYTVNIDDAYTDPRFNSDIDKKSGYHTRSILTMAVTNSEGLIVGVIQAVNKRTGPFLKGDEEVLGVLAGQAGIALHNAEIFHIALTSKRKIQGMLDIVTAVHSDLTVNSLIYTVTSRAHDLVEAIRCTFFILDQTKKELWSMQGEVNVAVKLGKGIAGTVGATGESINIPDAYKDARFNQEVDRKSGFITKCILCCPILDTKGNIMGVIQLINKRDDATVSYFTETDESIIKTFTSIMAPILASSTLFTRAIKKEGDELYQTPKYVPSKDMAETFDEDESEVA